MYNTKFVDPIYLENVKTSTKLSNTLKTASFF